MKKLIFLTLFIVAGLRAAQAPQNTAQAAQGIELTTLNTNRESLYVATLVEPNIEALIKYYMNTPQTEESEAFFAKMALIIQYIQEVKKGNFNIAIDISYLPEIINFCNNEAHKDNKELQECAEMAGAILASLRVLGEKFAHANLQNS